MAGSQTGSEEKSQPVSLADEDAVKEILVRAILDLWKRMRRSPSYAKTILPGERRSGTERPGLGTIDKG